MGEIINFMKIGVYNVSIFDVAKYFLNCVHEESGSVMTHLKLQKLCYYAQAWHLAFEGVPLFKEDFEAWVHGPVCSELWHEYKSYGFNPITRTRDFNPDVFEESELETLDAVWKAYGQFDPKYLEDLTHQEDPWLIARGECRSGEKCTNIITKETMKKYYSDLLNEYEEE